MLRKMTTQSVIGVTLRRDIATAPEVESKQNCSFARGGSFHNVIGDVYGGDELVVGVDNIDMPLVQGIALILQTSMGSDGVAFVHGAHVIATHLDTDANLPRTQC